MSYLFLVLSFLTAATLENLVSFAVNNYLQIVVVYFTVLFVFFSLAYGTSKELRNDIYKSYLWTVGEIKDTCRYIKFLVMSDINYIRYIYRNRKASK